MFIRIRMTMSEKYERRCLCEHKIRKCCWSRDSLNGHEALVGNVCVTRFVGIPTRLIFNGLRRITADKYAAPNEALAVSARDEGYVHDCEYCYLSDTARNRTPTDKQLITRIGLSQRIIGRCTRPHSPEGD